MNDLERVLGSLARLLRGEEEPARTAGDRPTPAPSPPQATDQTSPAPRPAPSARPPGR